MDFEREYTWAKERSSDMHQHVPWIAELSSECSHATELGVGYGVSTRAFLKNDIELHSYEISVYPETQKFFDEAKAAGRRVTLHVEDTREAEIESTEIMLVDSYHSYDQVKCELERHANKVSKYILFHDTELYGMVGQGGERGIMPAIWEFLEANHTEWELFEQRKNNNGMILFKRKTWNN
jgi:cephalosporin hydroxylase